MNQIFTLIVAAVRDVVSVRRCRYSTCKVMHAGDDNDKHGYEMFGKLSLETQEDRVTVPCDMKHARQCLAEYDKTKRMLCFITQNKL